MWEDPDRLWFELDETVLSDPTGDPDVLRNLVRKFEEWNDAYDYQRADFAAGLHLLKVALHLAEEAQRLHRAKEWSDRRKLVEAAMWQSALATHH